MISRIFANSQWWMGTREANRKLADQYLRIRELEETLSQRFAATVKVEEKLMRLAKGRDPLPPLETFMDWAKEIGIPDEYKVERWRSVAEDGWPDEVLTNRDWESYFGIAWLVNGNVVRDWHETATHWLPIELPAPPQEAQQPERGAE